MTKKEFQVVIPEPEPIVHIMWFSKEELVEILKDHLTRNNISIPTGDIELRSDKKDPGGSSFTIRFRILEPQVSLYD